MVQMLDVMFKINQYIFSYNLHKSWLVNTYGKFEKFIKMNYN